MKRILTGIDAYNKMLTTPLPEKTKTYTPVSHMEILNLVRRELGFRGYKLLNEAYSSNQGGTVITVACVFEYIADPEMSMSAVFVNSYDKTAKFQFKLGGMSKKHGTFVIHDGFAGSFLKRKHTGSAVDIIKDHVSESFNGITMVWDALLKYKEKLQNFMIDVKADDASAHVLGHLMLLDTVDSTQLSIIRDNLNALSDKVISLWEYYHLTAASMTNTHPKLWHRSFGILASVFGSVSDKYLSRPVLPLTGMIAGIHTHATSGMGMGTAYPTHSIAVEAEPVEIPF